MTYRSDSTIPQPYGRIKRKKEQDEERQEWLDYDETQFKLSLKSRSKSFLALAERPKLVAWIVSQCSTPSKREQYVDLLQKEIQGGN